MEPTSLQAQDKYLWKEEREGEETLELRLTQILVEESFLTNLFLTNVEIQGSPDGSVVKSPPANAGEKIQSLGWEDPLEKEMAIHSSIPAWEIPWTEEPEGLQSMESQKRHDLATKPPPPPIA